MKSSTVQMRAALAAAFLILSLPVLAQKHPRELPEPPALSLKMPKPVTYTLGNGIQVYYLQDTELPAGTDTERRLLDNPEWGHKVGKAGRLFVQDHHGWGKISEKLARIYEDVALSVKADLSPTNPG